MLDEARVRSLVAQAEHAVTERYAPLTLAAAEHGVHRTVLGNGLTLLVQEDHAVPLVAVRAAFLGGQRAESPATQGMENLLARLITRGTSTLSGEEIARRFDHFGGSISGFSGRNSFGLRTEFLAEHLVPALELLADCLLDPALPPEELQRERGLVLEEIRARDDNLASLSFRAFTQLLFGRHPYGFDLLGEEESVVGLPREVLRAHIMRRYTPSRMVLAVVGDVEPIRAAGEVNRLFGGRYAGSEPPLPAMPWSPPEARQVVFRYKERAQAHLVLGFAGTRLSSPDRFPLEVLTTILDGQGGRLFVELRDRRAMAYSVGAVNVEGIDPGYFAVYMATHPARLDEALDGMLAELRRVRDGVVSAEELRRAQQSLIGSQAVSLQRSSERATVLAFNELYGLGHAAHLRYPEEIQAVTLEQVQDAARKYIDLERYTLAVVKPEAAQLLGEAQPQPRVARK
ncbi:MAG: insulinase family protein [Deltaproteobacteria bacterium]|nr:insulinase family protein [Deltaproteobacteria bacterium]